MSNPNIAVINGGSIWGRAKGFLLDTSSSQAVWQRPSAEPENVVSARVRYIPVPVEDTRRIEQLEQQVRELTNLVKSSLHKSVDSTAGTLTKEDAAQKVSDYLLHEKAKGRETIGALEVAAVLSLSPGMVVEIMDEWVSENCLKEA